MMQFTEVPANARAWEKDTLTLHATRYSSVNSYTFANSTCFAKSCHNVNMALRVNDSDDATSSLPGLSYFWQEADKSPTTEWNSWVELFEKAVLARHSISISELLKTPSEQDPTLMLYWEILLLIQPQRKSWVYFTSRLGRLA